MDFNGPEIMEALEKSLEDTFEGIAFAQIFNTNKETEPVVIDDEICSYIDLAAPLNLRFFVMMKRDHVMECFESVYTGLDVESVGDAVLTDFVNELTNTAAGHFYSKVSTNREGMTIGLPVNPDREEEMRCLTPDDSTHVYFFQVEDYEFYASLVLLK